MDSKRSEIALKLLKEYYDYYLVSNTFMYGKVIARIKSDLKGINLSQEYVKFIEDSDSFYKNELQKNLMAIMKEEVKLKEAEDAKNELEESRKRLIKMTEELQVARDDMEYKYTNSKIKLEEQHRKNITNQSKSDITKIIIWIAPVVLLIVLAAAAWKLDSADFVTAIATAFNIVSYFLGSITGPVLASYFNVKKDDDLK